MRPSPSSRPVPAIDDLAELYVWGFPLAVMHRTRDRQLATVGPVLERDDLATATSRAVVAPNNDTLYSSSWFDLRAGDLMIDVAPMGGRYWSVMLLDAYTHVSYVSRRTHGSDGTTVRVTLDPAAATMPDAAAPGTVGVATPTVWLLVRVVVDGPDDLVAARAAQRSIRVTQRRSPASAPVDGRPVVTDDDPSPFARLAAAVTIDPPVPGQAPPPPLLDDLAALVADPSMIEVLRAGVEAGSAALADAGSGADTFADGWGTRRRGADFGDDATYRAAFARVSLAGHLPAENRGYNARIDGRVATALRFAPGAEPPVAGFWSLSLYGPDLFFIANEIDRFSIGDRTPGLVRDPDGGLTITIAHRPPLDADGRPATSNWLPAPDGPGVVVLRCYEGAPAIVDATWFPPPLAVDEAT